MEKGEEIKNEARTRSSLSRRALGNKAGPHTYTWSEVESGEYGM